MKEVTLYNKYYDYGMYSFEEEAKVKYTTKIELLEGLIKDLIHDDETYYLKTDDPDISDYLKSLGIDIQPMKKESGVIYYE